MPRLIYFCAELWLAAHGAFANAVFKKRRAELFLVMTPTARRSPLTFEFPMMSVRLSFDL